MDIDVLISSSELNDERLMALTSDFLASILKETDIDARLAEGPHREHARGESISLGIIVLTFIEAGALTALFNVIKSYFDREKKIIIVFRHENDEIALNSKNMEPDQIKETLNRMEEFLERSG
jgi:hypothetical protein